MINCRIANGNKKEFPEIVQKERVDSYMIGIQLKKKLFKKRAVAAEISYLFFDRMWKLNIYIFVSACFTMITRKERKKERRNTIKVTSAPFHVRKEVIIALYTADQARPIMTEGWTEQLLCADIPALNCPCRTCGINLNRKLGSTEN